MERTHEFPLESVLTEWIASGRTIGKPLTQEQRAEIAADKARRDADFYAAFDAGFPQS